ncbi:hypothetical protein DAPPUDRAFT_331324 [Daphnia pulex]|uniref:Uncharacterized protein n=1 Tax=Daphnia pulex TaxID=6669 RepID=E9HM55_DAPPU|nr:hypothetical protein DAPPUDRAFT_331324 [Daphnia pulex]|eukprot:EFX67197.1 hypothetical protein DAPPUDRAFT_331324 [Daphnia pulex]
MAPNGTILADSLTGYVLPRAPFTTVTTNQMEVVFETDKSNIGLPMRFRPACWQANYKVDFPSLGQYVVIQFQKLLCHQPKFLQPVDMADIKTG